MKTLVLLPVYSVVPIGGLFLLGDSGQIARGTGVANVTLHFVVIDSATNSPVSATD
jgi:hypothetical protein